jgi:hypothetical protein
MIIIHSHCPQLNSILGQQLKTHKNKLFKEFKAMQDFLLYCQKGTFASCPVIVAASLVILLKQQQNKLAYN